MLITVSNQLDKNTENNIEHLKNKQFFNEVEWSKVRDLVELKEFKKKNDLPLQKDE